MMKYSFLYILLLLLAFVEGLSQSSTPITTSAKPYHPPSEDKESWQRLNLLLSSTFIIVAKEGQMDYDVALIQASRSLGLSRISVLGEGLDDPDLLEQSQWIDQQNPGKAVRLLPTTKGKTHLQLLILLGSYYAFQPQGYIRYKDSVEYFLKQAIEESKSLKQEKSGRQALCLLDKMYLQANEVNNADAVFNRLIKECEATGDYETEARAFLYHSFYSLTSPATFRKKLAGYQKAADLYHNANNIEGEINALTDVGYLLVLTGQLQSARDVFLRALQLEEDAGYPYIHYNTDALAMVGAFEGKFGEPLKYALQTVKSAERNRDSIGWGNFYSRLSTLYGLGGGKQKESADLEQKAIDRFLLDGNTNVYLILGNRINAMESEGRSKDALEFVTDITKRVPPISFTDQFYFHIAFARCYSNIHQFSLCEMHLRKADSVETKAESIRGPLRRVLIHDGYAFMYYRQGQYHKARLSFEKYLLARPNLQGVESYPTIIKVDSILHDPAAGLLHYKKYVQALDSSFAISKLRQAEELQVLYQTEEKENQIAALNQQATLEQANLKQATLVKNLTIAGIIAVVIIAGLLYRQNRLKQKNNNVITHKNEQLQQFLSEKEGLLSEKEWLLKEIHHRVKNNLQIVMSLLGSQSEYIESGPALTAIQDSQHRVQAMSLLHQKLYNSENVSSIDISVYIRELVSYLADSFNTGQRIRFELAIEQLEMDVSQAVPLGLILNEAITNSIKYAFPNGRKGTVLISLSNTTMLHYLLVISDNGIGMPTDSKNKKSGSLGMSLIEGLTEDLHGNFSMENKNGTTLKISFVQDLAVKRTGISATPFVQHI